MTQPAHDPVDLPRYQARIGYEGPVAPTLDVLNNLQAAHLAAIPFEALDVLTGSGKFEGQRGRGRDLPNPCVVGGSDRKSVVYGKSVSVRVDLGGRRIIKKKILINNICNTNSELSLGLNAKR